MMQSAAGQSALAKKSFKRPSLGGGSGVLELLNPVKHKKKHFFGGGADEDQQFKQIE